jgi:phosphatidylserine/phosphatidylglycerophosphate/cardiolipin synthase-like enzyme
MSPTPSMQVAPVSMEQLVEAIESATREITVCTPSRDYYRRDGDWSQETYRLVDADALIAALRGEQ